MLNFFHPKQRTLLFLTLLMLFVLVLSVRWNDRHDMLAHAHTQTDSNQDMLAYVIYNFDGEPTPLMLYDPRARDSTDLFEGFTVHPFVPMYFSGLTYSTDARLAFSSYHEGNADIYVLDARSGDRSPVNITQSSTIDEYVLAWSPDGRFLAFESHDNDNTLIFVWDGITAINITPEDMPSAAERYRTAWSQDGRLAFTIWFGFEPDDPPDEIYLWDGTATTNLSQNPTGNDTFPAWSADGQLAFLSSYGILVWDGVSVKNEAPDRDSFIHAAQGLTAYYSAPTWTNDGLLAFVSTIPPDTHAQIYVWDGHTATNISQNPTLHNGNPRWSGDGRWAFVTFFSREQLVYVRDADNRTLLTVEGQYGPAWSPSGYLLFCRPGWILYMWDGREIIEVAQGRDIWAQWNGGSSILCSSG